MWIKTSQEINIITEAAQILADVKQIVYDNVRPGISIKDLDTIAFSEIIKRNAEPNFLGYQGFSASICASLNEELIHGVPNDRILKEEDLISIDMGLRYKGYNVDSAFTKSVGSKPNLENEFLIEVAQESFKAGLNAIKKGATIGDIGKAIGAYIKSRNCFTPSEFSGHGIGKDLHERPFIMNFDDKHNLDKNLKIANNMVLCIEPMILQDNNKIKILEDGWTVVAASGKKASHYEHTILIKDYKPIILTKGI
ncbi:type I methionyl aminopeptidase [Mycoplasma testudineum]|nr:type I methionyl aminopeptidase [Mycoplasma testudineum]